ncbi:MAG: hypothetical protein DSY42_00300 [Aquifex sp.]|nr:MAG: hypothetical protein DSY42_00300 [Aquifex sp.]
MNTGFDLKNIEPIVLAEKKVIAKSGVKWVAPTGYYLSVVPRSGISYKTPIVIANSPGTVEASYRGDIGMILKVDKDYLDGFQEYKGIKKVGYSIHIPQYTRLAQCLIHRTIFAPFEDIPVYYCIDEDLYENWEEVCPSVRGSQGYGSTGTR